LITDDPDLLTERERVHIMHKAGSRARSHDEVKKELKKRYRAAEALPRTLVVDTHGRWMAQWASDFEALDIEHTRSNADLHPCPFDFQSLRVWAATQRREDEMYPMRHIDRDAARKRGYGGPFLLPGTHLFLDFCAELVERYELAPLVTVPKVYRQASASRVLTLERLYGVSMTDLETVRKYTESPELALIVALNTWVSSVLTNEWFHADVHAGNLLMLKDGRVAFIDFGIVGSIPRSTADAMLDFVRAFPLGDMDGVARSLSGMGFTKELDARTSAAFAMDLQAVLDSIEAMPPAELANGVVDETQLNKAVAAVGSVATNYGIKFPREFVLLIKQVLYFDRYTRILAPGLNVLEDERLSMNRGPPPQIPVEVEVLPPE
jgi:hypothetical protein